MTKETTFKFNKPKDVQLTEVEPCTVDKYKNLKSFGLYLVWEILTISLALSLLKKETFYKQNYGPCATVTQVQDQEPKLWVYRNLQRELSVI